MNILITPDIHEWAIGKLTKIIVKHNKRFNFYNIAVHPRGIAQGLAEIQKVMRSGVKFDVWHAQYWNSAVQMMALMPELKKIPKILFQSNHNSLKEHDWKDFDILTHSTDYGVNILRENHPDVVKIPFGIDLDNYSYLDEYPPKEKAVGYVGRVVPWKNLDQVCIVSKSLGYKVVGCGYIDKPEYWEKVPKDNLEFNGGFGRGSMATETFETEIYRKMTCFVMYSTEEKESGTLPLLEAMSRGIPVLATEQGMARDIIEDGVNGILFNKINFSQKLKMVMEDKELQDKLRVNAWRTIKDYSEEKMALEYGKLYHRLLNPDHELISVIIPTFQRAEELLKVMLSVEAQDYPAKEMIICDDGSTDDTPVVVAEAKKKFKTPIRYIKTGEKLDYGLAKARNKGAIEAMGSILLFLDDRYTLEPGSLRKIVETSGKKIFGYGVKVIRGEESTKTAFIENFAWIRKIDFVNAGMFCERMDIYGGLSQETRQRFGAQGFTFSRVSEVKCIEIAGSSRNKRKDEIWKSKLKLKKMYE